MSAGGEYRLLYVAKFIESICVLHVFQKKSRKTSVFDIDVARARFRLVCRMREEL